MASPEQQLCTARGCGKPARMAIATERPTRGVLKTTIYFDNRTAPKKALPYCKGCGERLVAEMVPTLVDSDDT